MTQSAKEWFDTFLKDLQNSRSNAVTAGAIKTIPVDTSGMSGPDFSGEQGWFSKFIDFIERPLYALGGAATSVVNDIRATTDPNFKDKYNTNVADAFWKGLSGEEHNTLGTAVHAALPKNATGRVMAGILGLGADVVGDPLNLTPFAAVKVAKAVKGATKLGKQEAILSGAKELVRNEPVPKIAERLAKAPKANTTPTGVFKFTDFEPKVTISDSVAEQGINLPRTPAEIPTPELIINTQTKTKFPVDDLVQKRAVGTEPIDLTRQGGMDIAKIASESLQLSKGPNRLTPANALNPFLDAIDARFSGLPTYIKASGDDAVQHFINLRDVYDTLGESVTTHSALGIVRSVTPSAMLKGTAKALDLLESGTVIPEKTFKEAVRAEIEKDLFTRPTPKIAHNIRPALQGDVIEYGPNNQIISLVTGEEANKIKNLKPNQKRLTRNRTPETVKQGVNGIVDALWNRRYFLMESAERAKDLNANVTELAARSVADNVISDFQKVADLSSPAGSTAQTLNALNSIHKVANYSKDELLSTAVNRKVAERISEITNAEDFATAREIRANLLDVERGDFKSAVARRAQEAKNTHIPAADKVIFDTDPMLFEDPFALEVEYLMNKRLGLFSSLLHTGAHSNSEIGKVWKAKRSAYYSLSAKFNNGMAKALAPFNDEVQKAAYLHYRNGTLPTNPEVLSAYNALGPYVDQILGKSGGLPGNTFLRQGYTFDDINKALEEVGVKFKMKDVDSWRQYEPTNLQDFLRRMNSAALNMHLRSSVADHFTATFGSSTGGSKAGTNFIKLPKVANELDTNVWKYLDKKKYYPKEAVDQLIQVERLLKQSNSFKADRGGLANFVNNVVDPFLLIWKPGMTIARPGHGVRNAVSDFLLNTAAGVHSPRHYVSAMRILRSGKSLNPEIEQNFIKFMESKPGASLDGHYKVTLRGNKSKTYSDSEVYRMAFQDGILPSFVQQEDILVDLSKSAKGLTKVGDRILQTKYMQAMGNFNEKESHFFRLAQYVKLMTDPKYTKKFPTLTEARQAAATEVRKFHPDTSGLTPAEMKYMRRIIPYYSWTRQIIPVIAESLLIRPARITAVNKAIYSAGMSLGNEPDSLGNPFPDNLLAPDYIRDMMGYVGGDMAFNLGSPVESAADLFNGNVSRNFAGMLNPMIKTPVELYNREDIQTGSFISDLGEYVDRQIPFVNQLSTISGISASGTMADWLTGSGFIDQQRAVVRGDKNMLFNRSLVNFLSGIGLQPVNTPTGQRFAARELGRSGS